MKLYRPLIKAFVLTFFVGISQQAISQEASASAGDIPSPDRGVHHWKNSTGFTNFNVEVRGKIEVTDDDKDIKSLSNDGYLQITKTVFGSKRSITIESMGDGKISREYTEGRTKMPWDPNGRTWLAEILPEIVRSSTVAAEGRVNRIYGKDGTKGVLTEISKLEGDYTRAHYAKLLLAKNIPASEMATVITGISDNIHSDYYLSSVFQSNISRMLATPEAADAFYRGTKKIGSDYYKAVVLKEGLKKFPASAEQVRVILQSAATINSDYYLSVVLTTLLEQDNVREESISEVVVVSRNIPSDYYRTQVLTKAVGKPGIGLATQKNIVESLETVNSDFYKTSVFNAMADHTKMDPDVQRQAISLIGKSVGSDYYASSSLKSILENQKLSDESFGELVTVAGDMGSSNYASEVLREAAKKDLNRVQLIDILRASENINSDFYLTEVLTSLAKQVRTSDAGVKDAYRQAAKKIGSDSYYGKAVKAID